VRKTGADSSLAVSELGVSPSVALVEGLAAEVDWMLAADTHSVATSPVTAQIAA
jgi:hypothetical protein